MSEPVNSSEHLTGRLYHEKYSFRRNILFPLSFAREKMRIILPSLALLASVAAFRVAKVEPRLVKVKEGQAFRVVCTTDSWYEVRYSRYWIISGH